ncbi:MAG: flavin reductase family protein [Kiritimatiellia bacterium]
MQLRHDLLTHGVYVVTAEHNGRRGGLALAWATQIATDRVLICVGSQSATRELILASKAFGLSVLTSGQKVLARHFGLHSSRRIDKFRDVPWHTAVTGSPLLDDSPLVLDCRVEQVYDAGGSKLIVGRIVSVEESGIDFEPLIYRESDYS